MRARPLPTLWVLVALLGLSGCRSAEAPRSPASGGYVPPPIDSPSDPLPPYAEVVGRYNAAAAAGLERFSARVGVEIVYMEDGAVRRESGAGRLLYRRPADTALSVSVLGNTILWAGSDATRWWVFSGLQPGGRPRLADGPIDGNDPTGAGGLPFRPDAVPLALGLRAIDPAAVPPEPAVEGLNGFWLIEPPGLGARLLIDPRSGRPVRVDLLAADGRTRVVVRLDDLVPVDGSRSGLSLPRLIDAYPVDGGTRLTLVVRSARADDPVLQDRLFDLDSLIGFHRPTVRE